MKYIISVSLLCTLHLCVYTFQVHSFDQGICTYVRVTLCAPEKQRLFPFSFHTFTDLVIYTLCFLPAYSSDVTSQLFSRERVGASDWKNPDLYYTLRGFDPIPQERNLANFFPLVPIHHLAIGTLALSEISTKVIYNGWLSSK